MGKTPLDGMNQRGYVLALNYSTENNQQADFSDEFTQGYFYAPSSFFRLTECGWGFFTDKFIVSQKNKNTSFNLPVSLNKKGLISQVHLWHKGAKNLELKIDSPENFEKKELLLVPVQFSSFGGTYLVGSNNKVTYLKDKDYFINFFANHDESDLLTLF
ncbi:MAG: hypothetical protein SFU25_10970 [Candidatus Caenarcaniphilales bacterium]|nr:hypothetical protein [Candidatus Caenarcaniphilales bacterium]